MSAGFLPGLLVAVTLVGACAASALPARPLVSHAFDTTSEGWSIAGDTFSVEAEFRSEGGQSGGYIVGDDEALGETWYFRAPGSLLAHLPSAAGGTITYYLEQTGGAAGYPDDDIVIVGPAGRLSYRFAGPPGTEWTMFSVPLSASAGWRWNWNAPATDGQIASVLAHPTRFEIRGEYETGPDRSGLDTFVLIGP